MLYRLISSLLALALVTAAAAQNYTLRTGDRVRVMVLGLPQGDWTAGVEADGSLVFPYIGLIRAEGRTLDQVRADVAEAMISETMSVYGSDGVRRDILLRDDDIFVAIQNYSPITVTGAVNSPGDLPYSPGLTVRAAIANAGGIGTSSGRETTALDALNLLQEFERLSQQEASYRSEIWRLDSMLSEQSVALAPEVRGVIENQLGPRFLKQIQERVDLDLVLLDRSVAQIEEQLAIYEQRIRFLELTLAGYEEALLVQNEELREALALQERGIIRNDRMATIRNTALITNTRLLETQADLAEVRIERAALTEQLESGGATVQSKFLAERNQAEADLVDIRSQLAAARARINAVGITGFLPEQDRPVARVVVYRGSGAETEMLELTLNDRVLPGDVLDVILQDPAPTQ